MTRIEQYLTRAIELDALTLNETCAICAAMEGHFVEFTSIGVFIPISPGCCGRADNYLNNGTAALRLVERFEISLDCDGEWMAIINYKNEMVDHVAEFAATPQAAIVACVCALARERWNG